MNKPFRRGIAVLALATLVGGQVGGSVASADQRDHDDHDTLTPIKHVIVIIGENRTFDNLYGTYVPNHGQHVLNLLSQAIVRPDGSPGPNTNAAEQFQIGTINPVSYFISTKSLITRTRLPTRSCRLPRPAARRRGR
jgi:phospholipase C